MPMPAYAMAPAIPAHVPPDLVYDYDVFEPGPRGSDFFVELHALKQCAPPIFWTPYNGGHWYTTDSDLTERVLGDNAHFSNQVLQLPRENNPPPGQGFPPMFLDPPEHAGYRHLLLVALSRKAVAEQIPAIRRLAIELIETMKPRGTCDFITEFAFQLPVITFLRIADLPEKYHDGLRTRLRGIVDAHSDKALLFRELSEHLAPFVDDRIAHPGDDLISYLSRQEIDGAPIPHDKLHGMAVLLLLAGLDTVANTFTFFAAFLAANPGHRQWIRDNPDKISHAVDELMRRFPVVANGTARLCVAEAELDGARVLPGDAVLATPTMMNYDERLYPAPLEVDFERHLSNTGSFGRGPHRCVGAGLARAELSIFLEEWLPRIPNFRIAPDKPPVFQPGVTISYDRLILEWPTTH
jgi:cytochrome P450